ncbi:MAG: bifunctional glutamate N-acetyltransferase/amino-acid acetyltransferase ArgJ, partial [Bacteroidetes bacterium]
MKEKLKIEFLPEGSITSPQGFYAAGIHAGIKSDNSKDMALIVSENPSVTAAAFTTCKFSAAPVIISKSILAKNNFIRAVLINSGNANACTGKQGINNCIEQIEEIARLLNIHRDEVLICSTGRIGIQLPMPKIKKGIQQLSSYLSRAGGKDAAEAIMTTDTKPKSVAVRINLNGKYVTIGGIAKGAGMIAPKLQPLHATMIACITTDVQISPALLNKAFISSVNHSFNRITVDGDTSTNDTVLCLANGASKVLIEQNSRSYSHFRRALRTVMEYLSKELVKDAEGATKLITVIVKHAKTVSQAKNCAFTIANSLLCKTAWFGSDPNWGRILAAAGRSSADFLPNNVNLFYDNLPVVKNGIDAGTPEKLLKDILDKNEFSVILDLNTGNASYSVLTSDISYE